jgi:predicted Zn-dependent protease
MFPFRARSPRPHPLVLALVVAAFMTGCATNPVTGKKELSFVSEAQEIAAGQESRAATQAEYGFYVDVAWGTKVESLGKLLAAGSHRPDLPWEFHVVDDAAVNAFAAPGGFVYITRGILPYFNSEAELAGVLGHEIGHITARHYATSSSREQLAGLGLLIGSVFSESIARYGQVAQEGLGLLFLKYSRDQESESDRLGVDYSIKAGYDPREMPATYHTLARISQTAGARLPTFLSTHPDPASREATVRALAIAQVGARTGLIVNRDDYARRVDGLVFGVDPRQGYFEGGRFYHPAMKFTMDFPAGWQTQNGRSAVTAVNEAQKAVMQVSLVDGGSLSPTAFVQKLVNDRQVTSADGRAETIGGYDAWSGRLGTTDDQGATGVLLAVILRQGPTVMFRMLAQATPGSAAEAAFFTSSGSFRALTDAARLAPEPARVKVVPAPAAGSFGPLVTAMGPQALTVEETAILNGVDVGTSIARGRLLKIVTPAKLK